MSTLSLLLLLLLGTDASGVRFSEFLERLRNAPLPARITIVDSYMEGRRTPVIDGDTILTFIWYGAADTVLINGSIQNAWRQPEQLERIPCSDSLHGVALFHKTYAVPSDARLEYKFVVDGRYELDPHNVRLTPNGDFSNSEAAMPAFHPTPLTAFNEGVRHGSIDSVQWTSADTLIRPRLVKVYLPPGYGAGSGFPSVYVHDGESARRYAFIANILDNMIAARKIPPIVAVFVPSVERREEFAGNKQVRYSRAFCDELVPMITRRYRTARDPVHRGVMGISDGGYIALAMLLARTDVFHCAAGQSSTIHPALSQMLAIRQRYAPLPPTLRLYMDWGRFDIIAGEYNFPVQNRSFSRELESYGVRHRYREVSDGHDWASWRERMPEIFEYMFGYGQTGRKP
jgi:enterochelin esterase-like enzyme